MSHYHRVTHVRFAATHNPRLLLVVVLVIFCVVQLLKPVYGAELGQRSLLIADNTANATTVYQLSFVLSTTDTLGSISVDFCSNDALLADACTPPTGFMDKNAILSAQSGQTGFSVSSLSTDNKLILTRSPTLADSGSAVSYTLSGITNPSATGAFYARVQTFASTDASGSSSDYGGIAMIILNNFSITAEVPPYLIFCTGITIPTQDCSSASGDYIDFGELSSKATSSGSSMMLSATNSASGYSISLNGTTMESGNDIITPLNTSDVSRPGTSQFGINLRANVSPVVGADPSGPGSGEPTLNYDQSNFYRFVNGDVIASYTQPDTTRKYTASYIVNVDPTQPAGVYVSTVTYICLANF